jgi:hypothetical protein
VGVDLEACYLGLADHYFAIALLYCILCFKVAEGSRCREAAWEHAEGTDDHVVLAINFGDCRCLVYFAASFGDSFLLIDI